MLCDKPYVKEGKAFGCGQCLFCRINRARLWTHRIMLENLLHGESCFVTLTYADANLPADGSLVPDHMSGFVKSLRKLIYPRKLRYFGCGEYGTRSFRPHYHLILFGIYRSEEKLIARAWSRGFVYVGSLEWESARYVCGYVTKGMTKKDDARLQGRCPEFARMSLKPGIGGDAVEVVGRSLESVSGQNLISRDGDVPQNLRHGRKLLPLGRYLTRRLRERMGFKEVGEQLNAAAVAAREVALAADMARGSIKQRRLNIESRYKLRNKGSL